MYVYPQVSPIVSEPHDDDCRSQLYSQCVADLLNSHETSVDYCVNSARINSDSEEDFQSHSIGMPIHPEANCSQCQSPPPAHNFNMVQSPAFKENTTLLPANPND